MIMIVWFLVLLPKNKKAGIIINNPIYGEKEADMIRVIRRKAIPKTKFMVFESFTTKSFSGWNCSSDIFWK
jgi:hypothetical protein